MKRTILIVLALLLAAPALASDAERAFEHGFYLERAKRDYAGAVVSYRKALEGLRTAGKSAMLQTCRIRLASCLLQLGKTAEAQAVLRAADETPVSPAAPRPKVDKRPVWMRTLAGTLAARKVTVDFTNTPLSDVLGFIGETAGVPIVIDNRSLTRGELPSVTLKVEQLEIGSVLSLVLSLNNLVYALRCGAVVVCRKDRLGELAAEVRSPSTDPVTRKAWSALDTRSLKLNSSGGSLEALLPALEAGLGAKLSVPADMKSTRVYIKARRISARQALQLIGWLTDGLLSSTDGTNWALRSRLWAVGGSLRERRAQAATLAARGGGGPATERAVTAGLAWLAGQQQADGHWASAGKLTWIDPGLTALSTLAFLGAGHDGRSGPHAAVVQKALAWLVAQQADTGLIGVRRDHYMYNHAIGTLALVEAYALRGDPIIKAAAQKALRYLLKARNPGMAWRYITRSGDNDISVTSWAMQAMAAAQLAGLNSEDLGVAVADAQRFINGVTADTLVCGYNRRPPRGWTGATSARFVAPELNVDTPNSHRPNHTPTAMAVMCHRLAGMAADHARVSIAATHLSEMPPVWKVERGLSSVDYYYWYFGSMALFQQGDPHWPAWNRALKTVLLGHQVGDGHAEAGSWPPVDAWSFAGGRVYATAINTLTLQVYYRYPQVRRDD